MKINNVIRVILTAFLFLFAGKTANAEIFNERPGVTLSTWVWNTEDVLSEKEHALNFFNNEKVRLIYLQINRDIPTDQYVSFIREAKKQHISVFALSGSPKWIESDKIMAEFFKWVTAYQSSVSEDARFDGIQLDIEPYLTKGWKEDYQSTVFYYQRALAIADLYSSFLQMPLDIAIPFWFDDRSYNNPFGKGSLLYWVISKADRVTVMAYRDELNGSNGVFNLTKKELAITSKLNKKLTVALETKELVNQDSLTFFEEGKGSLNEAIQTLHKEYGTKRSFSGVAVHSYSHWKQLEN